MKRIIFFVTLSFALGQVSFSQTNMYNILVKEADRSYDESNYIRAFELYVKAYEKAINDIQRAQAEKKIETCRNSIIKQQEDLKIAFENANREKISAEKAKAEAESERYKAETAKAEMEKAKIEADSQRALAIENEQNAIKSEKFSSYYIALSYQFLIDYKELEKFLDWVYLRDLNDEFDEILKIQIERSTSIEPGAEKTNWYNLLEVMNKKQKLRLFEILAREKTKLQFIDWENETTPFVKAIKDSASMYFKSGSYEKSLSFYLLAIKEDSTSNNASAYANAGLCYRLLGDYDKALEYFNKRLKFDENNTWTLRQISGTYSAMKRYAEAYEITKELIVKEEENYNNWFNHSFYCLYVGKYKEAIQSAQKSLELNPEKTAVITNLALGYLLNNEWKKAETLYLEWKDKKFPEDERLANEIFLKDIQDLEEAGISHPDFEKVKKMMQE